MWTEMKARQDCNNTARTSETVEQIRKLIAQVCLIDAARINKNARLLAFGLDSLRVLELMMRIEDEFELQLEPGQLGDISTVGQLADYVERLRVSRQAR